MLGIQCGLRGLHRTLHHLKERDGLELQANLSGRHAGQIQQIINQPRHLVHLAAEHGGHLDDAAGLVRRRGCSGDPRAVYAVLTDDGRRMLEQAAPGHIAAVREFFLEAFTPEQLAVLADGLNEVARRARGEGAPSVTR